MDNNIFSSSSTPFDFGKMFSDYLHTAKKTPEEREDVYDWKKAYLTLKDDFESYRKRTDSARNAEKRNLTKEIVKGFLDVVDYILFTYKAKNNMGTYTREDEMVLNKISDFLKTYDVHPMKDPVGSPFDHKLHEAVISDNSKEFESGTVTLLISHGYMIGDEVLRYAKVAVAV